MSTVQAFDYSVNLLRALLWQYNDATRLQGLLERKQAWYDENHAAFWQAWVRDVFDLSTANDFGLSVWAIILDVPLGVNPTPDPVGKPLWAFGSLRENFNRGNFTSSTGIGLTTAQRRLILQLRYFQLVTRGTVPEINEFLIRIFSSDGPAYVVDNLDMTMTYVFGFALPSDMELIFKEFDLLPRPAGVEVNYVTLAQGDGWGFGRFHTNFTHGNFYHA